MGIVPVKNHRCPITILMEKPQFKQNHNDWFPEKLNCSKFGASVFTSVKMRDSKSDALSFCQALCYQAGKILIKNVLTRGKLQEHLMKVILRIIHSKGNMYAQHSNVGNQVNKILHLNQVSNQRLSKKAALNISFWNRLTTERHCEREK